MRRPPSVGGVILPRATGRCSLCGTPITDERAGSLTLARPGGGGKAVYRLCCRDVSECRARRQAQATADQAGG